MLRKNIILSSFDPRKSPLSIGLGLAVVPMGIIFDFYIFSDVTLILAYFPMMIMVGMFFSNILIILGFSLMSSSLLLFNSKEVMDIELFIIRWLCLFIVAFIIKSLMDNIRNEKETLINFTSTLAVSIDARDEYTAFHSRNVAYYSREIAKAMKLSTKNCDDIYIGGLLHDIGKIGVSEKVLNKPSRLTESEFNQIKQHPNIGYDMLKYIPNFKKKGILDMVLSHHEKFDGTGYPHGLRGEEIPLVARIIAISDVFDAMTSSRVYRKKFDLDFALNQIKEGKGIHFDPHIADIFLELIEKEKIEVLGGNNT